MKLLLIHLFIYLMSEHRQKKVDFWSEDLNLLGDKNKKNLKSPFKFLLD